MQFRLWLPLLVLVTSACEEATPPMNVDGGVADTGVTDGGTDSGTPDAGEPDSGALPDAGGRPARYLFATDPLAGELVRVELASNTRERVLAYEGPCAGGCPTFTLHSEREELYFTDHARRTIKRRAVAGGDEETIFNTTLEVSGLRAPARSELIYASLLDRADPANPIETIVSVDPLTRTTMPVAVNAGYPFDVDVERNSLWYTYQQNIYRLDLSTGTVTQATGSPATRIFYFAQNSSTGELYFVYEGSRTLEKLDVEARHAQVIVEDAHPNHLIAHTIAVDPAGSKIAWVVETAQGPIISIKEGDAAPRLIEGGIYVDLVFDGIPPAAFPLPPPIEPPVPRPAGTLSFSPCPDRADLECATLEVPIDHQTPNGDQAQLPVLRRRASREDRRIGVLIYDFGGPGYSFASAFERMAPDDDLAGSGTALLDRFDLITLERRGTPSSTPLVACAVDAPSFTHPSAMDWVTIRAWWTRVRADCAGHPLLEHMSSADVARDLDLLRAALGEEKVSLSTFSYGTGVAATYATLFPDRVRAAVLSSPTRPLQDQADRARMRSRLEEEALQSFLAWCAETTDYCYLASGAADLAEVQTRFDRVLSDLQANPLRVGLDTFGAGDLLVLLRQHALFPVVRWYSDGYALGEAFRGNRAPLTALAEQRRRSGDIGDYRSNGQLDLSIYLSVHALDRPFAAGFDDAAAEQLAEELSAELRYVGASIAVTSGVLAGWPVSAPAGMQIGPSTSPPLLIAASRHDYATNWSFAPEMQAALANGSHLITYEGRLHSATNMDECLGGAATEYLLDPQRAPATDRCEEIAIQRWR